ncbi:hypothetical protein [Vibrio sp. ER1A]|uniref:hypothetical protein n=1 Tax=Vibrio sp. ER1A TaxID=1517681 RepID=UPI0004DD25BD|nr:hypothetical protein [Vibrio sp. ER1A]KFA98778.1 hypothetical protein HW45_07070 [Vibrio sp. ER1A]
MINPKLTLSYDTKQVVTVTQGSKVSVLHLSRPTLSVVSIGAQGPVGTVAEEVLNRVEQMEHQTAQAVEQAQEAKTQSDTNSAALADSLSQMTNRFNFYAGAISAVGGK